MDGLIGEWAGLPGELLSIDTASNIQGSQRTPTVADLSASLRLSWAAEGLYAAAVITDDVLIGNNSPNIWEDDVMEISVHVPSDRTHQISLALDGRQGDQGVPISSVTFFTRTVPGGWQLEAFIPAGTLGLPGGLQPATQPFNFAVWDDDVGGVLPVNRQTHMMWQGASSWAYAPDWGWLVLADTLVDFVQPAGTGTPTPTH